MKEIIILIVYILSIATILQAHPGRTDSEGGHSCRSNCSKWGLSKGQYHYHNKKKPLKKGESDKKSTKNQKEREKVKVKPDPCTCT